jgi:hypothetical protein
MSAISSLSPSLQPTSQPTSVFVAPTVPEDFVSAVPTLFELKSEDGNRIGTIDIQKEIAEEDKEANDYNIYVLTILIVVACIAVVYYFYRRR